MPFICKCQKIYKVNDKTFKIKLYFDSLRTHCGLIAQLVRASEQK